MRRLGPLSVRTKLAAISLGPAFLMGLTAAFTFYTAISALGSVDRLFGNDIFLKQLKDDLAFARAGLQDYIATKNTDSLRSYISSARRLAAAAAALDKPVSGREIDLAGRNVSVLVRHYIAEADRALEAKRGRNVGEYTDRFRSSETLAAYVAERVDSLSLLGLERNVVIFKSLSRGLSRALWFSVGTIVSALLFVVALARYFSRQLTDPIARLSAEAARISSGTLDGIELAVDSDDELGAMTRAFNLMKLSIAQYIDQVRSKAEIEARLLDERVKNLEMAGALRNAEIRALQARINPHFLFNTLNAGIQLSVIEGAERTRVFLENLAALMRYSFRNLEAPVTLGEECDYLESYIHVMGLRFPDLFSFSLSVGVEERELVVPKMIIQPLIENSFKHGFRDRERGALLSVRAGFEGGDVVIEVEDNGRGMSEERVAAVFAAADRDEAEDRNASADASGIGLVNVIHRLRLFSRREQVMLIGRGSMGGTLIAMRLPLVTEY